MAIAITEDHHALARTAAELLQKREARRASRELLEAETEPMPAMWDDIVNLGWLGLHLPEAYGGSGYGIEELVSRWLGALRVRKVIVGNIDGSC